MPSTRLGPHHPFVSAAARETFLADYERLLGGWPTAWEASTVETDLGSTAVMSRGPLGGTPLVMLPGAGGDAAQWPVAFIDALARTCRVMAVDNIEDFGRSVCSRPVRTMSDRMRWLDQLLDALSPGAPAVLAGCSRGGWLTAEYTLHAPQRLAAAVWMSPALVVNGWSAGALRFVALSRPAIARPSRETVDPMLRWLLPAYAAQHPEHFAEYMVGHTTVCFQCFDTSVVGRGWGPRRFSSAELASIRLPVLYLAGADERLCSSKHSAKRLAKVAPAIRTAVLPRAGHDLVWVQTDEVSRRILDFVDGLPRPATT